MLTPKSAFGCAYVLARRYLHAGEPDDPDFDRKNRIVRYHFATIANEAIKEWHSGRALYVWVNSEHVAAGITLFQIWVDTCSQLGLDISSMPPKMRRMFCEKFALFVARADTPVVVFSDALSGEDRELVALGSPVSI